MNLLDVFVGEEGKVFKSKGCMKFYKKEKGELLFFNVATEEWELSNVSANRLNLVEAEKATNWFDRFVEKERVENNDVMTNETEEEKEVEFNKIKEITFIGETGEKIEVAPNFDSYNSFKKAKYPIYLSINDECTGLSVKDFEIIAEYASEMLRLRN